MDNTKEIYDFLSETWKFVKQTTPPKQLDNAEWERIISRSNELCTEYIHKMADWMDLLRRESINGEKIKNSLSNT